VRLATAIILIIVGVVACSSSSSGQGAGAVYVSPTCPLSFSVGQPGIDVDAGPLTYACQPLPSECASNPTCECAACAASTCGPCVPGSDADAGQFSNGGGGGATCSYDPKTGTFTVTCINA
jgi:hypothetical protein